jgi:hypothetical protein
MKKNWLLIGLAVVLLLCFLYIMKPVDPKAVFITDDIKKDHSRFTPTESVDIAMAMKLITHAPPQMLNPPSGTPTLLLYPPSADDLARLSGA